MPSILNSNSSSHNIPFESSPPTYCIWLIILQGFFRRSIQQKIQYRPCTKNQQCAIQRVNRNRCQYCRLKKCIAAGMSRDGEYYLTISRQSDNLITQMSTRDNRTEEMTKTSAQLFLSWGMQRADRASMTKAIRPSGWGLRKHVFVMMQRRLWPFVRTDTRSMFPRTRLEI